MNRNYSLNFLLICIILAFLTLSNGCTSGDNHGNPDQDIWAPRTLLLKSSGYGVPSGLIVGFDSAYSGTPDMTISSNNPVMLKSALENSINRNKTILLNANINLSTLSATDLPIVIQEGITLVGNRSSLTGTGAIISINHGRVDAVFRPSRNVTISGLRLVGPSNDEEIIGIHCLQDNITVHNCELSNWTRSAVGVSSSSFIIMTLNKNYIHNNLLYSSSGVIENTFGYGISIADNVNVQIYENRYEGNRHSIAGAGLGNEILNIFHNVFDAPQGGLTHNVDMHGRYHQSGISSDVVAGKRIDIRNNDFNYTYNGFAYIKIRGVPDEYCRVERNWFNCDEQVMPVRQGYVLWNWPSINPPFGHMEILDNEYSTFRQGWDISYGGNNMLQPLTRTSEDLVNVTFIDLDGDGRSESFKANGIWERHHEFKLDAGILYPFWDIWDTFANSSATLNNLAFGDFNSDGNVDVFTTWGGKWHVAFTNASGVGTNGGWQDFSELDDNVWDLRFGDFNGDGKTDVFRATGAAWQVAYTNASGTGIVNDAWKHFANSSAQISNLRFGDFNGDNKTDVFSSWGGAWYVAHTNSSGTGTVAGWQHFASSNMSVNDLALGDFNGDGNIDVFASFNGAWKVAYTNSAGTGTVNGWQTLNANHDDPLSSLKFADIDGDGKTDVVLYR